MIAPCQHDLSALVLNLFIARCLNRRAQIDHVGLWDPHAFCAVRLHKRLCETQRAFEVEWGGCLASSQPQS